MNNKKKILVISMRGGFGHIRAGEAIMDYARENMPNMEVEHVNIANIDESLKTYASVYEQMSKKMPILWSIAYKYPIFSFLTKRLGGVRGVLSRKIKNYVLQKKPDVIIFTNSLIIPLFFPFNKNPFLETKIGVVITDYHGHAYHNFPFIDCFFVSSQNVARELREAGVGEDKIVVSGIPINPRFYIEENVKDLKVKYGIGNNHPVVLVIASFKITKEDLLNLIGRLTEAVPPINVIVLANGQQETYDLVKDNFSHKSNIVIVNWTNLIEEYIKISDVVVSKAGGLTVSECLTLNKKMIIINPIPGQEEYNTKFIESSGFGLKANKAGDIVKLLHKVLSMKNNSQDTLPKGNPSEKILKYFL